MQSSIQKWNLKIKFRFQTIMKLIQILFSKGIQIYGPLFLGVYFSSQ
jgi:hypothetical protein